MSPWARAIAVEQEEGLSPDQFGILSILAIIESFFEEVGVPLTEEQIAALRSAEGDVRGMGVAR